jgi:hypothetical protein
VARLLERWADASGVVAFLVRCVAAVLLAVAWLVVVGLAGLLIGHGPFWSQASGWVLLIALILPVVAGLWVEKGRIEERLGETVSVLYLMVVGGALLVGVLLTVDSARSLGPAYQMRYGIAFNVTAEEYRCVPTSQDPPACDRQRRLIATATEQDLGWWPACGYDPTAAEREQLRVDPTGWFATYQDCSAGDDTRVSGLLAGPEYLVVVIALWLCWYVLASACRWLWRTARGRTARRRTARGRPARGRPACPTA